MLSVHLFKLKDADVQAFLEEATALDPRFKSKLDRDEIGSGKQQWQQPQRQLQKKRNKQGKTGKRKKVQLSKRIQFSPSLKTIYEDKEMSSDDNYFRQRKYRRGNGVLIYSFYFPFFLFGLSFFFYLFLYKY